VITDDLGAIVGEMGDMVQTFSPAFALNDTFRRQLERIRRRPTEPATDPKRRPRE
jgi:hypothetical protein